MAVRPVWKGHIRLSLVSIPVEIFSATRSGSRLSFRQIHKPSGKPVRYQKTVPGVGPVDTRDIWSGYEIEKGEYVLLDPSEIDDVKLETRKTLELVQFVGACEIPPIYFDRPYFIAPQDELAEDAYRVLRDALNETEKIALGQLAMRGKEYLSAVRPCGSGLMLETLRYEEEIREADRFYSGISPKSAEKDLVSVATQLIERKTAPFDADSFEDRYADALRKLIDEKSKGRAKRRTKVDSGRADRGDNVIDLETALKKSLQGTKKGKARKAGSTAKKKSA